MLNERFYFQADYRSKEEVKLPHYMPFTRPTTSVLEGSHHHPHHQQQASNVASKDFKSVEDDLPPRQGIHDMVLSPHSKHTSQSSLLKKYYVPGGEDHGGFIDGDKKTASREVTVFGFPQAASASVLSAFESIGTVEEYELGAGNWMHLNICVKLVSQQGFGPKRSYFPWVKFHARCCPFRASPC